MAGVTFDRDSAKRISKVVKRVESEPQRMGGRNTPTQAAEPWFWAKITMAKSRIFADPNSGDDDIITDSDVSVGRPALYSWIRVYHAGASNFIPMSPTVSGEASARCLNPDPMGPTASGTIVKLHFVGYSPNGKTPLYAFTEEGVRDPEIFPPHDHRSNDPKYGGFAFAVYAPGTALPQMPWAV